MEHTHSNDKTASNDEPYTGPCDVSQASDELESMWTPYSAERTPVPEEQY